MTKPFNYQRKPRRGVRIFVGAFILVFFLNFIFPSLFPMLGYFVFSPVWFLENKFHKESGNRSFSFSDKTLLEENRHLRSSVLELEQKLITFNSLKAENEALRGMKSSSSPSVIIASVLSRPNTSPYDTFLVDAGKDKGVSAGDYVLANGSIVIGRIIEVRGIFSKVLLFSAPRLETTVAIGPSHIETKASGLGGGNILIRLPHDSNVSNGDLIVIPELGNKPIGQAVIVNSDPNSASMTVLFTLPVNIFELGWVDIEKSLLLSS